MIFYRLLSSFMALAMALPATWAQMPLASSSRIGALSPVTALATAERDEFVSNLTAAYYRTLEVHQPLLADFLKTERDVDAEGRVVAMEWRVSPKSSLLDKDPFFLRSQKWVGVREASPADGDHFVYRKMGDGGLLIQMPGAKRALQIAAPLTPLTETSDYLILVADSDEFFADKLGDISPDDQGVFFINKKDYVTQSLAIDQLASDTTPAGLASLQTSAAGLPIYFFLLPGRWAGAKVAFEWAMRDQIALYDQENFPFLIDIHDFRRLEQLGQMNLQLAQAAMLLAKGPSFSGALYPPENSTACFGLVVSGLTTREIALNPARTRDVLAKFSNFILPQAFAEEQSQNASAAEPTSWWQRVKKKTGEMRVSLGMTAAQVGLAGYALTSLDMSQLIPPDMMARMTTAGSVIGLSYLAAVVLKYTIYKEDMQKKYPITPDMSRLQKIWQEMKSHLDIFPYNTNLVEYAPMQTFFNVTSLAIDRWMPKNKLMRALYENTFGWINRTRSSIPVTWRPLLMGLAEGHAASLTVAVSLLVFYPWLYAHMGWQIATGGAGLAAHFISSEIIRVYFDYWRGGGHIYTMAKRVSLLPEAVAQADRVLDSRGLDPTARSTREERKNLIDDILNEKMTSPANGMADRRDFKFDFNSLVSHAFGFFGVLEKELRTDHPELKPYHFVFSDDRWALMKPALNEALKRAREAQKATPTDRGAQVVAALEWAEGQFGYMGNFAREAWGTLKERQAEHAREPGRYLLKMSRGFLQQVSRKTLAKGREIRKLLWLTSTSGDPQTVFDLLPPAWVAAAGGNVESAKLATELLHYSIHSLNEKNPDLLRPTTAQMRRFHNEVYEELHGRGLDPFEYRLRYEQKVSDLVVAERERKRVSSYNPLDFNFYERRQYKGGVQAVQSRMNDFSSSDDMHFEFARAVTEKMGLFGRRLQSRENSALVQKAERMAKEETEARLATEIETAFLGRIDTNEQAFYKAWVFTQEFLKSYVTLTSESDEVPIGSPERLGPWQRVRGVLANAPGYEKFFKPCILIFETLFKNDIEAYQTGLKGAFSRLPLLPDFVESVVRAARGFPYAAGAGYLIHVQFFQSTMTWPQALLFSGVYSTVLLSVQLTNRLMDNFGLKPMRDMNSRLIYTYVLSWLVSVRYIPMLSWSADFDTYMRENFFAPVENVLTTHLAGGGLTEVGLRVVKDCVKALMQ